MQFEVEENGDLGPAAKVVIEASKHRPIVLFKGDLGVGKTTLIKSIGHLLGIDNQMNSPSFGLINAYNSEDETQYFHVDLFRLRTSAEAWDIGLIEVLDSGCVCWVEWPEILDKVWQTYDALNVVITADKRGTRRIFVNE